MTSIDVAMLVLRAAFGLSLLAHGANKVRGANGLSGTAAWFSSIGMRWPSLQARTAACLEIAAGALLALGLFTSVAAATTSALMVVAIVTVHLRVGYFIFLPNGGWEYCASIIAAATTIAIGGPGRVSVDHSLDIGMNGWSGALLVGLGFVAATAHLAVSYRPGASNDRRA